MEEFQNSSRRRFLRNSLYASGFLLTGGLSPASLLVSGIRKLTILHTNDTHSRIDPFPLSDPKFPGLGGVARRAEIINNIRRKENNVLLLDSGDIFQGTPYFNLFGGEVEFKAMSAMKYDCATFGNHDFDNGIDGLVSKLPFAKFPFINTNYRLEDTALSGKYQPYTILIKDGIRIGIIGIGIDLNGLVDQRLVVGLEYTDPVKTANETASLLMKDLGCNLVICLSHLGYKYNSDQISDVRLAALTKNIDIILGGHTHTFLDQPDIVKNSEQKNVLIAQTGFAGIRLGRIDLLFCENGKKLLHSSSTIKIF